MIKRFLLLLIIGCNLFYAQTNSIEKLTYQELGDKFYSIKDKSNVKESKSIAQYYLKKAKSENNKDQIAEGYVFSHFNEDLPISLKYIDSLESITKNSTANYYPARIYLLRGNLYFKFHDMKSALSNYVLGLKYAKEKGNKRQIALADISIAFLNNYIGKHEETAQTLRYYSENADYLNATEHSQINLNLADTYIELNKMDSANILIQRGLHTSLENKDLYKYHQYLLLSGFYKLELKEYKAAVDILLICEKYFSTTDDERNKNYVLLYLGKSYDGLQEKENAVQNFAKIDSIIYKTNYIFPELREVYTYLINYYKEKNNKEKQLYYIERFLKIDQVLDSQFRYISRELPRQYDKPKLLKEKENIINDLESRKTILYFSLAAALIILLLFVYLYYKSQKTEKKHKKIAQDLIQAVYENRIKREFEINEESFTQDNVIAENVERIEDKATKTISEDVIKIILRELETFEAKEGFLKKGITLGELSKKIKTNSKYLSEIINTHKGKNFAAYLNDLRIDYAIKRLAKDKKFRSYKIPFIAEELGYNNEQAFTLAFKKRTGTPLSIYLKEIEKSDS